MPGPKTTMRISTSSGLIRIKAGHVGGDVEGRTHHGLVVNGHLKGQSLRSEAGIVFRALSLGGRCPAASQHRHQCKPNAHRDNLRGGHECGGMQGTATVHGRVLRLVVFSRGYLAMTMSAPSIATPRDIHACRSSSGDQSTLPPAGPSPSPSAESGVTSRTWARIVTFAGSGLQSVTHGSLA